MTTARRTRRHQLAHIAGPGMPAQRRQRVGVEIDHVPPEITGGDLQEVA